MEKPAISFPDKGDLDGIVKAQANAWLATYISPENGVSEYWVNSRVANLSAGYISERIDEYKNNPNILYLVAKTSLGDVMGFLHAERHDTENVLEAIYLDPGYIGTGTGGILMEEALAWVNPTNPTSLEVAEYNNNAIGFYEHFGFEKN